MHMRFETGEINIPGYGGTDSEDTTLVRSDIGVFGVFDGMGGPGDGDVASRTAKEAVERFYERENGTELQKNLHQAGHTAREAVMAAQEALQERAESDDVLSSDMGTTATIGRIFRVEGEIYLAYAHVGDSGLLIRRYYDGHLKFVTEEESEEHVLHNALSARGDALYGVRQYGVTATDSGDRLVFFTDGISGDTEEQRLSEEEYRRAVSAGTSREVAHQLAETSRKTDDKAVVVVDVV